jgi:hypothetical protein
MIALSQFRGEYEAAGTPLPPRSAPRSYERDQ